MQHSLNNSEKGRKGRRFVRVATLVATGAVLIFAVNATTAQEARNQPAPTRSAAIVAEGLDSTGKLSLMVNKGAVLTTKVAYKRVSVGAPDIADVNPIGPGNILVTGKKAGNTQLIIWDDSDRSQIVDIQVAFDLDQLREQLKQMFPHAKIEVNSLNGALALRGRVPSLEVAEQAVAVASPYSQRVLNLMEISGVHQVMLQVRFAEVSRSATSQLGVNFNYASGAFQGASTIGQVNPSFRMPSQGTVGVTPPPDGVTLLGPTLVSPGVTLFGSGQIGNFYFEYFLQALRQNNLLRLLAEPNLIAVSGQEANFLAGGEYPIPVTQGGSGTGGTAVTVEYREFGVRLRFVPIVLGDGRIRLRVAPEVSDLDFTTAVRFNGFVVPGLTTRKLDTTIELADGQSFAIAGLLNNSITASKDVTPGLGDLPVIGVLFRSVRYQRKETELVVLVTPRLVEPMNPGQVPRLPGEKWRDPTEAELFLNRDLGGEIPDEQHAPSTQPIADADVPRFRGTYGFVPATQPSQSAGAGE
ncbi:MAG: type II and III secretion system protein family protein [Tepidisphaeraceae bacterium]